MDFLLDGGVWAVAPDEGPGWGSERCPESEVDGPGIGIDPGWWELVELMEARGTSRTELVLES